MSKIETIRIDRGEEGARTFTKGFIVSDDFWPQGVKVKVHKLIDGFVSYVTFLPPCEGATAPEISEVELTYDDPQPEAMQEVEVSDEAINDPSPFDNAIAFAWCALQNKCILDLEEALGERLVKPDLVLEVKVK